MAIKDWNVTYDLVTEESAREGDYAESGFLLEDVSLREAFTALQDTPNQSTPIEADSYPVDGSIRWLTAHGQGPGGFEPDPDVLSETRSLHIPQWVRPASRVRLARLLGTYGT